MIQVNNKNLGVLFVSAVLAICGSARAQDFKGFYGISSPGSNYTPASRYYDHGRHSKHSRYSYENSAWSAANSPYYPNGTYFQSFSDNNRSGYPPLGITINIFSSDRTPVAGSSNYYYNNGNSNPYNNGNSYPYNNGTYSPYTDGASYPYNNNNTSYRTNNNEIPPGAKTTKINGEKYYEMNGNYYRADRINNTGNANYRTDNRANGYYTGADVNSRGAGVYLPAANTSRNAGYYDNNNYRARTVYAADGNPATTGMYADKAQVDNSNSIFMLQQEQKALKAENDQLKQKDNERQAKYIEELKAENDRSRQAKTVGSNMDKEDSKQNNEEYFSDLKIGDTVDQIPKSSKTTTINGQKTYISPRNVYYQKQKNGKFTVVGMEGQ